MGRFPVLLRSTAQLVARGVLGVLAACSHGGSSSSVVATATVSGTAATGAPIANARITLKDRSGSAVTTTTRSDGSYVVSVAGKTAPFLIMLEATGMKPLFSAAAAPGVANVHPVADQLVDLYYRLHGLDVSESFDHLDAATPMATQASLRSLSDLVTRTLAAYFAAYSVDAATFDPLTSKFLANGSGFDAVLAITTAPDTLLGPALAIDDSDGATGCMQVSQFTVDPAGGTISTSTDTQSADGSSEWIDLVRLPRPAEESAYRAAFEGCEALLRRFVARVNARGAALVGADLLEFLDPQYLEDGYGAAAVAADIASGLAGVVLSEPRVVRVVAFEELTRDVVEFHFAAQMARGGIVAPLEVPDGGARGMLAREQDDGTYRLLGNLQIAEVMVETSSRTSYDSVTAVAPDPAHDFTLECRAMAPSGVIDVVEVTGLFPPDPDPARVEALMKLTGGDEDEFVRATPVAPYLPPTGTTYHFSIVPVAGVAQSYARTVRGNSDAPLKLVGYDDVALADCLLDPDYHHVAFVHPGTPLTVRWLLPAAFPIASIELRGDASFGGQQDSVRSDDLIAANATRASITFPATVGGGAPTHVYLEVVVHGRNGETLRLQDSFQF